jgi:hypothetical protein
MLTDTDTRRASRSSLPGKETQLEVGVVGGALAVLGVDAEEKSDRGLLDVIGRAVS